ncbi:MAG: hypothetical protein ACRDRV_09595 [Pseudonocardiaceae bacterium]
MAPSFADGPAHGRPPFVGKARGLAAGTLLACGSVLAVAVHTADNSGAQKAASPGLVTVEPGAVSGGFAAPPAPDSSAAPPVVTGAQSFTGTQLRPGSVLRNVPRFVDAHHAAATDQRRPAPLSMPGAEAGQQAPEHDSVGGAIAPVTEPVVQAPNTVVGAVGEMIAPQNRGLTSAAGLSRLTPGSLAERLVPAAQAPLDDALDPLKDVVGPLEEGAQPAMTMLSPWDWAEAGRDQSGSDQSAAQS